MHSAGPRGPLADTTNGGGGAGGGGAVPRAFPAMEKRPQLR